jgi:hypothetical protein
MPSTHPTSRGDKPTANQLRCLRSLAISRGQTFTSPRTKAEASAEISRLLKAARDDGPEREAEGPVDATAIRADEVTGHGANARWAREPAARPERAPRQHELARYELPDGKVRALVAERIQGRVAITDMPKTFAGRVYLVERHVQSKAEMDGLVAVYVADSRRRGEPAVLLPADLGA